MRPAVSVIIASYNAERFIGKAISSVLAQTFQNFEIVVVDDGSTDRTEEVVRSFADSRIVYLKNEVNKGPSYARNRAISQSAGEWIAILDADDWWHENRLRFLLSSVESCRADIAADDLFMIREGEQEPWTTYFKSREWAIGQLEPSTRIDALKMIRDDYGYLKPLFSSAFLKKHRLDYRENLRYGEDFRFVLECLQAGARFYIFNQPFYYYRVRKDFLPSEILTPIHAQIHSIQELIVKYKEDTRVVRALNKYISGKKLILTEFQVRQSIRDRQVKKTLSAIFSQPRVIKPLMKKLMKP